MPIAKYGRLAVPNSTIAVIYSTHRVIANLILQLTLKDREKNMDSTNKF